MNFEIVIIAICFCTIAWIYQRFVYYLSKLLPTYLILDTYGDL